MGWVWVSGLGMGDGGGVWVWVWWWHPRASLVCVGMQVGRWVVGIKGRERGRAMDRGWVGVGLWVGVCVCDRKIHVLSEKSNSLTEKSNF